MNYSKVEKIAIIGCGYWGTNVAKVLNLLKIKKIICFDTNEKNLKTIAKRFKNVEIAKKLSDILDDQFIKAIFICVPTSLHYSYAKKCLLKGKNIFVEKPLSNKSHHIKNLLKISTKKKLKIMSGYIYIFNKYIKFIKEEIIAKNSFGKIIYIEFIRKNYGPIRKDVSSLWDLASHDISILKFFYNAKFTEKKFVRTSVNKNKIYDIYNLNFKINKIPVNINVSWLYPEKIRQISIIGTKKVLIFDELNLESPIRIYNKLRKYPSPKEMNLKLFNPQQKLNIEKPMEIKFKNFSPLSEEIKYFLNAVYLNKPISVDGKFAYKISKELETFE